MDSLLGNITVNFSPEQNKFRPVIWLPTEKLMGGGYRLAASFVNKDKQLYKQPLQGFVGPLSSVKAFFCLTGETYYSTSVEAFEAALAELEQAYPATSKVNNVQYFSDCAQVTLVDCVKPAIVTAKAVINFDLRFKPEYSLPYTLGPTCTYFLEQAFIKPENQLCRFLLNESWGHEKFSKYYTTMVDYDAEPYKELHDVFQAGVDNLTSIYNVPGVEIVNNNHYYISFKVN